MINKPLLFFLHISILIAFFRIIYIGSAEGYEYTTL
ncbi:MAG: hypothetical protein METHAR1v1_880007 [Methanothrix sp.]|nr:MAG: hypothetical protein METHAR1v1_880007 [Methanothrix sp.]